MKHKELENELIKIKDSVSDYLIPSYNEIYQEVIKSLIKSFRKIKINKIVSIDMKGLMYGPIIANKLKVPFVPILKGNKITDRKCKKLMIKGREFIDYSGKKKSVEIFEPSIRKKDKILLVDDWFESGNTGKVAIKLIEKLGGEVKGISVIFNQLKSKEERYFKKYNFHFLVRLKPRR